MLTEMTELSCKMKEEMKAIKWIKENIQETNHEGKETGIQINDLEQKEEQNEERRIRKTRRGLGTSETTLKVPTFES